MSLSVTAGLTTVIIAKTIDAAPRIPDHEIRICCLILHFAGISIKDTASGRAIKVRNRAMQSAGNAIFPSCEGKESSPKRKKQQHLHKSCYAVEKVDE